MDNINMNSDIILSLPKPVAENKPVRREPSPEPAKQQELAAYADFAKETQKKHEEARQFVEAVQKIVGSNRDLQLDVDQATQQIVAKVVNIDSGEVVRQIPNPASLKIAASIAEAVRGLFMDQRG